MQYFISKKGAFLQDFEGAHRPRAVGPAGQSATDCICTWRKYFISMSSFATWIILNRSLFYISSELNQLRVAYLEQKMI